MSSTINKKDDGTILLTITLPTKDVKKAQDEVVNESVKNTTLPGFRKGMAPKEMVSKGLDPMKVQEEVLRHLLPQAYAEAVKEHSLQPVMSPRIKVTKLGNPSANSASSQQAGSGQEDWEFTAETAEAPKVDLGGYKDAVKKITAKAKIVVSGKNPSAGSGQDGKKPNMDEIVKAVLDSAKITVPQVLIETESERLLSQLLDEVKSLGLSLDQYLLSTHKTIDQVKQEYQARAKQDISFEFILQAIATEEKITVEQKELEEALEKAQSPEERQNLEKNIYLLASILRQQKTLDYLKNL